jgi:hypothetical protein
MRPDIDVAAVEAAGLGSEGTTRHGPRRTLHRSVGRGDRDEFVRRMVGRSGVLRLLVPDDNDQRKT